MFLIVLSHWAGHGSWNIYCDNSFIYNKVFIQIGWYLGEVANCVFIIISGYFSSTRERLNKNHIFKIIFTVKYYALLILVVALITGIQELTLKGIAKGLFPIIYRTYWFVTPFIALCLIAPLINKVIQTLTKKQLIKILLFLSIIELILPIIRASTVSSELGLFILYYIIGGCIKKYGSLYSRLYQYRWLCVFGGIFVAVLSVLLFNLVIPYIGIDQQYSMSLIDRFSFLPLVMAIGLFLIFLDWKRYYPVINYLAGSSFSVYLISENPNLCSWFWLRYFDNVTFYKEPYMILISLAQCAIVMTISLCIDLINRIWFEKLIGKVEKQKFVQRMLQ